MPVALLHGTSSQQLHTCSPCSMFAPMPIEPHPPSIPLRFRHIHHPQSSPKNFLTFALSDLLLPLSHTLLTPTLPGFASFEIPNSNLSSSYLFSLFIWRIVSSSYDKDCLGLILYQNSSRSSSSETPSSFRRTYNCSFAPTCSPLTTSSTRLLPSILLRHKSSRSPSAKIQRLFQPRRQSPYLSQWRSKQRQNASLTSSSCPMHTSTVPSANSLAKCVSQLILPRAPVYFASIHLRELSLSRPNVCAKEGEK